MWTLKKRRRVEDCEHELVFQKVVNDCWFVHLCKRCDQVVLSNRIEGVIEDEETGGEMPSQTYR